MRPLVLYHANCNDGFCAAWVAHRKFGDDADYIPVQYGQEPPPEAFDKDRPLYILDFSYSGDVTFKLAALRHQEMVVLDHHKTAQAALEGLELQLASNNCGDALTVRFDMGKSGGRLTWDYFFGDDYAKKYQNADSLRPWLVDYTEDRDLWRKKLPKSEEISAFIRSWPFDFDRWTEWDGLPVGMEPGWTDFAEQGSTILRYQKQVIDSAVSHAVETEIAGHRVLAVNTTVCFSEVAGELAKGKPFGAAFFIRGDGKKQWSLRSAEDGLDVSEIAKQFGGGGHKHAAGFEE